MTFKCPITKILYKDKCKVKSCIANFDTFKSGCIKQEPNTEQNLAKVLKISKLQIRKIAKVQADEMLAMINIKDILDQIPVYEACPACGIKNIKNCNQINCSETISKIEKVKKFYRKYNIILDNRQAMYMVNLKNTKAILPLYKSKWKGKNND